MAVTSRRRCATCGANLRARDRFCASCGTPLDGAAIAPRRAATESASLQVSDVAGADLSEQRKVVTILFADLSGSTVLGERLDPEELRGVLASYFNELARQIRRYEGTIDKYIGDAVMAVFGAPISHEDDSERAINAALAMQQSIGHLNDDLSRRHGVRLSLRIGINTGEVVAGLLAGDVQDVVRQLERHPQGDAVGRDRVDDLRGGTGQPRPEVARRRDERSSLTGDHVEVVLGRDVEQPGRGRFHDLALA